MRSLWTKLQYCYNCRSFFLWNDWIAYRFMTLYFISLNFNIFYFIPSQSSKSVSYKWYQNYTLKIQLIILRTTPWRSSWLFQRTIPIGSFSLKIFRSSYKNFLYSQLEIFVMSFSDFLFWFKLFENKKLLFLSVSFFRWNIRVYEVLFCYLLLKKRKWWYFCKS